MDYKQQLRDPRWQRKRLEALEASGWECCECGSRNNELHVHHYRYSSGTAPWDYPDDCYGVMCNQCHSKWHAAKLHCDRLLAGFSLLQMEQLRGLIAGLRCVVDGEDYYIESYCDPMFIASLVRGFWPPPKYQKQLLDDCLLRAHRKECFWFSDAVANVIPDCAEYRFVHCWLESVGHGGTSR